MKETATKRRRWRWVVLAAVLLMAGGPFAWQFRPLNADERAFVGCWNGCSKIPIRFDANHWW